MKNQNLIFNYLISIIIFFILITNSIEKLDFSFLEKQTLDNLRQTHWTAFQIVKEVNILYAEKFLNSYDIWKNNITREILISYLSKDLEFLESNLLEKIKDNQYFSLDKDNALSSLKKIIKNKDLPKNYIINIAFNIDKYDRTQKQAINGVSDYINYYKREEIEKFIENKLDEYFDENTSKEELSKIVLNNNYIFDYKDISSYINQKTKNELIQIIYGYENYCYNSKSEIIEEDCQVPYSLYEHNKLDTYSTKDLIIKIGTFNKKLNLNNVDEFILKIENRNFIYPNNIDLLNDFNNEELKNNIIAFETYYKRQTKEQKSLKKLKEYIDKMDKDTMTDILDWGINLYPELGEKGIFKDITSSETNLQYGKVKLFLKNTNRDELLKYALNIHIYQNNITSIYDKNIYDFIRMSDNKLYEQIFRDINKNRQLQEKQSFLKYASLHEKDIEQYLYNTERNQLKIIANGLINLYITRIDYTKKMDSTKKELIDSLNSLNKSELIGKILEYTTDESKVYSQNSTEIFEKSINDDDEKFINRYFNYYSNIMDFFRSTNVKYLRIWLRKYELIIRKLKFNNIDISGGLKTNYMNSKEFTKKEILKIFDIYVYEYPELFTPENFIKYVGLDTGITPHKYLVENVENDEIINKISYSIIGLMQRKNIQIHFEYEETFLSIITEIKTQNPYSDDDDDIYIKHRYLYILFRLINILPELNNMHLFNIMCVNDKTRIINMDEFMIKIIEGFYDNDGLNKIVNNIKYYYNKTNQEVRYDNEPIIYINNFLNRIINETIQSRVIDGDFYPIIYDYSLYLNDEKEIVINNIFNKLLMEKKITIDKNNYSKSDKISAICEAINKYEELQNSTYFDQRYNCIDNKSEEYLDYSELFEFLQKSDNKNLFYYCLVANILKYEYNYENDSENITDIFLKIHYMSRISMIRYILDVAKFKGIFREKLSKNNLQRLVNKYMVDIGSDNIYDLTLY